MVALLNTAFIFYRLNNCSLVGCFQKLISIGLLFFVKRRNVMLLGAKMKVDYAILRSFINADMLVYLVLSGLLSIVAKYPNYLFDNVVSRR